MIKNKIKVSFLPFGAGARKSFAKFEQVKGFALIATLSVLILLALIAVGLLSLSSITLRTASQGNAMDEARANARMALILAIADLQEAAGPDQRVTAVADIMSDRVGMAVQGGKSRWAGVWNTENYNPSNPNAKPFVRWLVSGEESDVTNEQFVTALPEADDTSLFESLTSTGAADPYNSVKAPTVDTGDNGGYAYWVEDEGVKADLAWNEGAFSDAERKQAARLSAASGPDYGVFASDASSPLNGQVNYPIEKDSTDNAWLSGLEEKALSVSDMPLVMGQSGDFSTWLKTHRHNISLNSRGVLADVKKGGLRRDLSLAFEMDGSAEVGNATNFNNQIGEFVGSGNTNADPLSAPQSPAGLPGFERFLWRDFNGAGNHFSNEISTTYDRGQQPIMRGPNWWALRDYANLYKRMTLSAGEYTMAARPYYPNRSTEVFAYSDLHSPFGIGQTWDREMSQGTLWPSNNSASRGQAIEYLYRPAQANYAPVNLGTSCLVGLQAVGSNGTDAKLAVSIDPFFYFWNPYNRNITCDNIVVTLGRGLPGRVRLNYIDGDGADQTKDLNLHSLLQKNVTNKIGGKIIYLINGPFTLAPGEVVIAQPLESPAGQTGTGEAELGYSFGKDTGIIMTDLVSGATPEIRLPLSTRVGMAFVQSKNGVGSSSNEVRHELDTSLAAPGMTLASLVSDFKGNIGEQTQHNLHVLWSGKSGPSTYVNPEGEERSEVFVKTESVSALTQAKRVFGAHAILIKPASDGAQNAEPFEMFSRLNPAPMLMNRDFYVQSFPNQVYRHITANSEFEVRSQMGIEFSGSARNTFWGLSYQSTGSTSVPLSNIPTTPLQSLVDFSHANISVNGTDPFHAVGNSWSNPMISPVAPYGPIPQAANVTWGEATVQDFGWLINDALFDRYFLSGIAPGFTIGASGYQLIIGNGTLKRTLEDFYGISGSSYLDARANPVLEPYLPDGKTAADVVAELDPGAAADDGYKKLGAYSFVQGAFNVNSTSVEAWESLLRSNRGLDVSYAQGQGVNSQNDETPFPSSSQPSSPGNGAQSQWSGLSRLDDSQISSLAQRIVEQVKLRGPFMSISDFVNRRVGMVDNDQSYAGALQMAIDLDADINVDSRAAAANSSATDANAQQGNLAYNSSFMPHPGPAGNRRSTTGIPGDITQADLLRPLAPRLAARTDTFRIRGYGEVRDGAGNIIAQAICEAVMQRLPEYVDPETNPGFNEAWDEYDPNANANMTLSEVNQTYGRRFEMQSFRWLDSTEV